MPVALRRPGHTQGSSNRRGRRNSQRGLELPTGTVSDSIPTCGIQSRRPSAHLQHRMERSGPSRMLFPAARKDTLDRESCRLRCPGMASGLNPRPSPWSRSSRGPSTKASLNKRGSRRLAQRDKRTLERPPAVRKEPHAEPCRGNRVRAGLVLPAPRSPEGHHDASFSNLSEDFPYASLRPAVSSRPVDPET